MASAGGDYIQQLEENFILDNLDDLPAIANQLRGNQEDLEDASPLLQELLRAFPPGATRPQIPLVLLRQAVRRTEEMETDADDVLILSEEVYPLEMVTSTMEEEVDQLERLVNETDLGPPGNSPSAAGSSDECEEEPKKLRSVVVVPPKENSIGPTKKHRSGSKKRDHERPRTPGGRSRSKGSRSSNQAVKNRSNSYKAVKNCDNPRKAVKNCDNPRKAVKNCDNPKEAVENRDNPKKAVKNCDNTGDVTENSAGASKVKGQEGAGDPTPPSNATRGLPPSTEIEGQIRRPPPEFKIQRKPVVQVQPQAKVELPPWLPVPQNPIQHLPRAFLRGMPLGEYNWDMPSTGKAAKQLKRVPFPKPIGPPEEAYEREQERIATFESRSKKKRRPGAKTQLHLDDLVSSVETPPAQPVILEWKRDGKLTSSVEVQTETPMEMDGSDAQTSRAVVQEDGAEGIRSAENPPTVEAVSSLSSASRMPPVSSPSAWNQGYVYSSTTGTIPKSSRPKDRQPESVQRVHTQEFRNSKFQSPTESPQPLSGRPRPLILRGRFLNNLKVIPTDDMDPLPGHCQKCHGTGHSVRDCGEPIRWAWCENCGRRGGHVRHCKRCAEAYAASRAPYQEDRRARRRQARAARQETYSENQAANPATSQGISPALAGRLGPPPTSSSTEHTMVTLEADEPSGPTSPQPQATNGGIPPGSPAAQYVSQFLEAFERVPPEYRLAARAEWERREQEEMRRREAEEEKKKEECRGKED